MKYRFLIIILLLWAGCFSQAISIDTNTFTVPQLVTEVLVNKACVPVTNITWRTGTNFSSTNGIGYFKNTNPEFPLSSGVILGTGNVAKSVGPNTSELNDGNTAWVGDSDLEATLLAAGITMNSTNATVLEFDFVPFSANFNFDFVFASEEYGNFQCQFSDAFAFLLTNVSTGVTTNLAVVPRTTTPISVVTIRESLYNSSCPSENPDYFGVFNGGSNAPISATNFNGQTVQISAFSNSLIPNTKYHIKLVIADRKDSKSDSAIFLGANSFNVGQDVLGPDLTVIDETAICEQKTHTLVSGLNPAIFSFAWTYNGNPIGGNTPNLTISQPGVYGLTYTIITTNCPVTTDFVKIEYFKPVVTPDPVNLFQCDTGQPNFTYNLSFNTPIVQVSGTRVSYHFSAGDADVNKNPLPTNYTIDSGSLPATIWMRILNPVTNCAYNKSFQLKLVDPPIANNPGEMALCETTKGTNTADFDLASLTSTVLGGQLPSIYSVSYHLSAADANTGTNAINATVPFTSGNRTLFVRVQSITDPTCFNTTNFKLVVVLLPTIDQRENQFVCISYKLPPLNNAGNYYFGPNQGLPILNAGDEITKDQRIYIFSTTSGPLSCSFQSNFDIRIIHPKDVNPNNVITCDEYIFPPTPFGLRYFSLPGGPNGGGKEYLAGSKLTVAGTTTIYTYFSSTDTANPCLRSGQYDVTIYITPKIIPIANVFQCVSYSLPPLIVGDYYTYDSITGIYTPAISPITNTTTLYVFASNNICRSPDTIFTVYIKSLGLSNLNACVSYNLPPAPVGEYRDAPNGAGNIILPGQITKTTKIYTYISGATCPTDEFTITINAPFLSTPVSQTHCNSFTLPTQTEGGDYYTLAGGPSTPGNVQLFPNTSEITKTLTIYIYKPSTTLIGCYNEKAWVITINQKPIIDSRADIEQCNSYVLTPLTNGVYYDDPNGKNPLTAGTVISKNNRIYIFAAHPNDPFCFTENFFDISINGVEADPIPTQLSYCESFTFPPLPSLNNFYYDATGGPSGGGNIIPVGTTITASTVLPMYYIYTESGGRLNCSDEKPFRISIAPKPIANPVNALVTCDSFANNDGVFEFDLTSISIRNQVLNGQTPDTNFKLTFYHSLAEANDIAAIPIANPATYQNSPFSDTVWIRVTNNSISVPCFDVVELKLVVNLFPEPELLPEYFICEDFATGTLLNPAILDSGISGANYLFEWTFNGAPFGGNSPSITTSQFGDYVLKATNIASLCSKTVSAKVIKYAPSLEIKYSDAFEYPTFITINVLSSGSGNYAYQLDDFPIQESNTFNNVLPGEHTISVIDKNGHCNATMKAIIINYPKFFTPNGDGFNELWNIPHLAMSNPNAPINIFDRYGKLLKQISPTTEGWNGTFNGQKLPSTDYWFTVDYDEKGRSKVFKSHFSLKR